MIKQSSLYTILATAVLVGCAAPNQQNGVEIRQVSKIVLSKTGMEKYVEFRQTAPVYSAMYVTSDGRGGGRSRGDKNLVQSKENALENCRYFYPEKSCILYAVAVPEKSETYE